MKVKVAKTAGFCMGVQRAMNKVLDAANSGRGAVFTYGPLIHNPQVIEMLEDKGVKVVDDAGDLSAGTVLIRAHGVPPKLREEIKASPAGICDATCPKVGSVQSSIKKHIRKGYTPIIVGDAGHPEVVGLMGYSDDRGIVVNSVDEIDGLPALKKVVVVAQTTQDEEKYSRVVEKIRSRYREVISFDTICESTHLRQEEVRAMSGEVDAVVVVGGKNSGNTRRMAEISSECGARTYHIETEEELTPELFHDTKVVGVTAGASTPDWTIRRVVEKLSAMQEGECSPLPRNIKVLLHFLCCSGIYTALSALGLTLTAAALTGNRASPVLLVTGALFVFSQRMALDLTDRDRISFTNLRGGEFLEKYRSTLAVLTVASCAAALLLSLLLGPASLTALAIAFALGLSAPLRRTLIKSSLEGEKDIIPGRHPKETEITISLSWAMGLAGTSAVSGGTPLLPSLLAGAMVFMVSLLRLNIIGLRDIQGDKMLGRMTQAVRLGEEKTIALIYRLTAVLAALPAAGAAVKIFPAYGYLFAFLPVYILILMKLRRADALYLTDNFLTSLDTFMLLYLAAALYRFIAA